MCLRVGGEDELLHLAGLAKEAGLVTGVVRDAGRTQVGHPLWVWEDHPGVRSTKFKAPGGSLVEGAPSSGGCKSTKRRMSAKHRSSCIPVYQSQP